MKKKLYIITLVALALCLFTGCGKKKEETTEDPNKALKDEVVEFVNNKLPAIEKDRDNAVAIYNSYFESEDVDLEQFSTELQGTAIPAMQTYVDNLTAIEVSTDEVKALKEHYRSEGAKLKSLEQEASKELKLAESIRKDFVGADGQEVERQQEEVKEQNMEHEKQPRR